MTLRRSVAQQRKTQDMRKIKKNKFKKIGNQTKKYIKDHQPKLETYIKDQPRKTQETRKVEKKKFKKMRDQTTKYIKDNRPNW